MSQKDSEKVTAIARSEGFGELLGHSKPASKDFFRSVVLGLLCLSPGALMLLIILTSENNNAQSNWWLDIFFIAFVLASITAAAVFIFYAFKKSKHQILVVV
ncbi:hypothetical protein H6F67_24095 [Microcoleus sp. FACHB-1515]|uniref:hypothetical protein n=1 Tax=Cyanophyceae TaxID=3028117 RepID=UPI00168750DF|nr:hypothetical protein [Microcoleus sp. FACHB-1515]MBD2092934.1 hypothetical protein [Microcoleus sp. FACHB-1515]